MRYLVYHGHFQNKGAEGMLRTIAVQLRRRLGADTAFEYYFEVPPGEYAAEEAAAGISQAALPRTPRLSMVDRIRLLTAMFRDGWTAGIGRWHVRYHYHRAFDLLRRFDGLIDASGLAYSDAFGPEPLRRAQWFWIAAAARRLPVVFIPQSWGPFNTFGNTDRRVLQRQLKRSAAVFVRDEESIGHLQRIGVDPSTLQTSPDVVFAFSNEKNEAPRPSRKHPAVAIAPNMRLYDRTGAGGADNPYIHVLAGIAERIAAAGYSIVLLPHEIILDSRRGKDDRFLCGLVAEILSSHGIPAEHPQVAGVAEIRREIASCRAIVASRFHAAVLGLAAGLPAFLLGWQDKYAGLMRRLGMTDCVAGMEDLDAGRQDNLLATVDSWLCRREELAARIQIQRPGIMREVEQAFDGIAGNLSSFRNAGENRS